MIQDIEPSKLVNVYRPDAVPAPDSVICFIRNGAAAMQFREGQPLSLPRFRECPEDAGYFYLFTLDDEMWFLPKDPALDPPDAYSWENLRVMRQKASAFRVAFFGLYTAFHLASWYRSSRFCGACGSPTRPGDTERSLICTSCGNTIYPRINPAVIVGVTNGDRILLTKYANRPGITFYALIAGFAEIGETFEDTVRREVMEEAGIRVKNIRYYASQPWGIADDLLAGFFCDVDGSDEISLDSDELKEAVWVPREEVTGQPNDFSLTNHMMMLFKAGREPR